MGWLVGGRGGVVGCYRAWACGAVCNWEGGGGRYVEVGLRGEHGWRTETGGGSAIVGER